MSRVEKIQRFFRKHRYLKIAFIGLKFSLIAFLLLNIVLAVLSSGRTPLFTRLDGHDLSLVSRGDFINFVDDYSAASTITINTDVMETTKTFDQAGIMIDAAGLYDEVSQKSGLNSIPLFFHANRRNHSVQPQYLFNQDKLHQFAEQIASESSKEPRNPGINLTETGKFEIDSGFSGHSITAAEIIERIVDSLATWETAYIDVSTNKVLAREVGEQLEAEVAKANSFSIHKLTLVSDQKNIAVDSALVSSFLKITQDDDGNDIVVIDEDLVADYLQNEVAPSFYIPATSTKRELKDGVITSEIPGKTGQLLNIEQTKTNLIGSIEGLETTAAISLGIIEPKIIANNTYTRSNAGLAQLIKDFDSEFGGSYYVGIRELDGGNLSAYYQAGISIVPASTYKIFLAYAVLSEIEAGNITATDDTGVCQVKDCIDSMILNSTNETAKSLLDLIGWSKVDQIIHTAGFTNTSLNNSGGGYMSTNVYDQVEIMQKLHYGSLLNSSNTNYLINLMKQQVYRAGIPAGSSPSVVANKVGFLEAWNHDTALVYSPSGTYAISIMTSNSNFDNISVLAERIYDLLN